MHIPEEHVKSVLSMIANWEAANLSTNSSDLMTLCHQVSSQYPRVSPYFLSCFILSQGYVECIDEETLKLRLTDKAKEFLKEPK